MDFGKKYRVGNFEIIKVSRSLTKNEIKQLRDGMGLPKDIQKHLTRGAMPYIKVRAISGIWSLEWSVGMVMFNVIESADFGDLHQIEAMKGLLSRFYTMTSVLGDAQMEHDIQKAITGFLERVKAKQEDKEEERAILDNIGAKMKAEKNMSEIQKEAGNEGD